MKNLSLKNREIKAGKVSCSIVGARGYAGLELAKILLTHPSVDLKVCFATTEFKLSDFLPGSEKVLCMKDSFLFDHLTDVVFLATPAEVSLKLAPEILQRGSKVIDLSGAFRLKAHDYQEWYGFDHTEKCLLAHARYGLVPWAGPETSETCLISNPGCFATAVSMALIPLLKENLISAQGLVIDAKSGSTGAGKKANENLLFSEIDGECLPYKVGKHQHQPEIEEVVQAHTGQLMDAHFVTSLLPVRRGIIAGIYARLTSGKSIEDVEAAFAKAYLQYPLVSFARIGKGPSLLPLKKVVGTAKTHISFEAQGDKLFLFSCIDNLLKGAASQAVENLNRMLDLALETGLKGKEAML